MFTLITLLSGFSQANAAEDLSTSVMDDARIFAQFDQEIPAVVSYFTKYTEIDIVRFYSDIYGKPIDSKTIRERLELTFVNTQHNIRIIISQQDKLRQVDILVTQLDKKM
jgi:hypothetical protein